MIASEGGVRNRGDLVNDHLLDRFELSGDSILSVYEPAETMVVLGAGRRVADDVRAEQARVDGVPIRFRRGGGGSVVLSPGQLVVALVTSVARPFWNREYARRVNDWIREVVETDVVGPVDHRGISDLAIRNRKILGTSVFRRRQIFFYQASLLVDLEIGLFDRYLEFPDRVPEYRNGRTHTEFCTTLRAAGSHESTEVLASRLAAGLGSRLTSLDDAVGHPDE